MKDFYKILGVKINASEEEIRVRWIELTKRYHPDRGEDKTSGEKIREINEAYQILKHSSTRVEYDLQRTYGQEKRGSYFKKLSIPASLLIIFIIVGLIYFNRFQTTSVSELTASNQINQTNLSRLPSNLSVQGEMQSLFHWDLIAPTDAITQRPKDPKDSKDSTTQRLSDASAPTIQMNSTNPTNPITQLPNNLMTNRFPDPIESTDAMTQRLPDPPDTTDLQLQLAQFKPPSLLATEEEVIQFFGKYIERYKQKDIDGFLSLFSSRAAQNRKDGLDGIRKIYTDFFDRSQTLRYRMVDRKIEIYENGVEVRARYELEQILIKSGEKKVWRGTIRWVLVKEDGILKIISLDYQHERPS